MFEPDWDFILNILIALAIFRALDLTIGSVVGAIVYAILRACGMEPKS